MLSSYWPQFSSYILELETQGLVRRTFRRLDPERQQAVLQAILDEAAERGPKNLSMKRVAERAGVAVGSLYQYFPNRDGMLEFAIELCVRYVVGMFEAARQYMVTMPLRQALDGYLSYGVEWSQELGGMLRLFARAAYQDDPALSERLVKPIATAMRQTILEMLLQAVERGEIRPGVDLEAAARAVNALFIAVADPVLLPYLNTYFQVTDESMPAERVFTAALEMLLHGIAIEGAA
jgi:TetR/AcrR family transcriptional regulator